MALLAGDGTIHIASYGVLNTRPFTKEELDLRRRGVLEGDLSQG